MLVDHDALAKAVALGDLHKLSDDQKVAYYEEQCTALGLTRGSAPLSWQADDNGHLKLAINKGGAEQLRKKHGISIFSLIKEFIDGVCIVTVAGKHSDGREDIALGARDLEGVRGIDKANAIMAAETTAKRRLTVSLSGAGLPDAGDATVTPQNTVPRSTEVPEPLVLPTVNDAPAEETTDTRDNLFMVTASEANPAPTPEQAAAVEALAKCGTLVEPEPLDKLAAQVAHQPHTERDRRDDEPPPHTDADQPGMFITNESVTSATFPTVHPIFAPILHPFTAVQPLAVGAIVPVKAPDVSEVHDQDFVPPPAPPTPTPVEQRHAVAEPASDDRASQIEFKAFTARCTHLVRDVLQKAGKEGQDASLLVLPYIRKVTGKEKMNELTVAEWTSILSKFDAQGSTPALIKFLKQGVK